MKELKLDGLVNADEAVIQHLERGLTGNSSLIPVGKNKDGSLNRYSRVLAPDDFRTLLAYTKKKERELKERILSGETRAWPYELGTETGCDYCAYRDICGFDDRLEGCEYQHMDKLDRDEAVERMRQNGKEQQGDERKMDQ